MNGSVHTLKVQTHEDVAVDTQCGGIFEPHDCAGSCLFTAARETSPEGYVEEVAPAMCAIRT